jgi:hypothetical protein
LGFDCPELEAEREDFLNKTLGFLKDPELIQERLTAFDKATSFKSPSEDLPQGGTLYQWVCASCGELHMRGKRLSVLEFSAIADPLCPSSAQVEKVSRGLYTQEFGQIVHVGSEPQPCEAIEAFKEDMSHNHVALNGLLLSTKGLYQTDDDGKIVHVGAGEVPELVATAAFTRQLPTGTSLRRASTREAQRHDNDG